jgi:hypothetical protein
MSDSPDPAYEAYKEQRFEADRFALEIGGRFDKMIIALSGGALALSITFLEKIAPEPIPGSLYILGVSWFLLVISLLLNLSTLAESQNALQQKITNADNEMRKRLYPDKTDEDLDTHSNKYSERVSKLSLYCKWTCILGVSLLATFALFNATQIKPKEKDKNASQEDHKPIVQHTKVSSTETGRNEGIIHSNTGSNPTPEAEKIVENKSE